MSTFMGEPHPGFFKDPSKVEPEQPVKGAEAFFAALEEPVKETGPTDPVANSYAQLYGPTVKPPIGAMWTYDYNEYVYDGSMWIRVADTPLEESPASGPIELTGLTATTGAADASVIAVSSDCVNRFQISDGSNFQNTGLDLTQLAEDVASIKSMLQKLVDQGKEIDLTKGRKCDNPWDQAEKENDYDRAMGIVK